MSGSAIVSVVREIIEWSALAIEILGALVIVGGVIKVVVTRGTIRYLFQLGKEGAYESYKHQLGKTLLLGLEFLVAGDVVRTVALEPTMTNVGVLGVLVLIRTFLSWSLVVEIEGRWPWQAREGQATSKGSPALAEIRDTQGVGGPRVLSEAGEEGNLSRLSTKTTDLH